MSTMLQGRVVLLMDAGCAQGDAIARDFAAQGAQLVLVDQVPVEHPGAWSLIADSGDAAQVRQAVEATVERFGRLDVLITHSRVLGAVGSLLTTSLPHWRATQQAVVDASFLAIQQAARVMQGRGGVILNLVSIAGVMGGQAPHALTTAHHAVVGLTRSAASELSGYGIRVNAVASGISLPGAVSSPLPGAPGVNDVAEALVYLASDAAAHVTAHTLNVDAGVTAGGFASGASVLRDRPIGFIGPSGQASGHEAQP